MPKVEWRILSLVAPFAAASLLAVAGGLAAQGGGEQRAIPHLTGTVARWNGSRIDLKTADGKTEKVAVNRDTEVLAKIEAGAEVRVEYRRKISGFFIAERVLPAGEAAEAAQPGAAPAPGEKAGAPAPDAVTGSVVSWNDASLVLRTEAGEVTLFLSPETEYLVKSLDPGLRVIVEYQETAEHTKLATRVRVAAAKEEAAKGKEDPGR